ncbi:unnamed protein product [Owenia fusiformis]|uniref:Uncharacterized protein n=1 Tax=Owenia fusiformis TaxID=6347 RepID=A0A8J1TLH4_OWEFU|nr:unnamed protein product [Owenia fusiformis]
MAQNLKICEIEDSLKQKLTKFRFRKSKDNGAIVMKIDSTNYMIILDEEYEDNITIEELQAELPEHLPRYVAYSYVYHHGDGRISYPLCFIFISPSGCKPEIHMLYAGSKLELVNTLQLTKAFELRDLEEFTEEWLKKKLAFFR